MGERQLPAGRTATVEPPLHGQAAGVVGQRAHGGAVHASGSVGERRTSRKGRQGGNGHSSEQAGAAHWNLLRMSRVEMSAADHNIS